MRRSMNGKDLPPDSREMEAIIAYIKFLGKGTPEGVRIAGMGLMPLARPASPPDARRGEAVYAKLCANCHKADGQGELRKAAGDRLFDSAAVGRCELQCRRRHGQDRLRRILYPRQHAVRHQLSGAGADRAAGVGRRGLHDVEAASAGARRRPPPSCNKASGVTSRRDATAACIRLRGYRGGGSRFAA